MVAKSSKTSSVEEQNRVQSVPFDELPIVRQSMSRLHAAHMLSFSAAIGEMLKRARINF